MSIKPVIGKPPRHEGRSSARSDRKTMALASIILLLVPACFLNQSSPPNSAQRNAVPPAQGIVFMEELQGDESLAGVLALFVKKPSGHSALVRPKIKVEEGYYPVLGADWLSENRLGTSQALSPNRDTQCKLSKSPRSQLRQQGAAYLDAGKVSFGPVASTRLADLDEDNSHQYSLKLNPGISSNLYKVDVAGSNDVAPFQDILPFPEAIDGVELHPLTLEEDGLGDSAGPRVSKSKGFELQWKRLPVFNDANQMVLDFYVDTNDETYQLHCEAPEKDFYSPFDTDMLRWNLPPRAFVQLPASATAQVYLMRRQAQGIKKDNLEVQLEGVRAHLVNVQLTD